MFTGLIQNCGTISEIAETSDGIQLVIVTDLVSQMSRGDSVAVNGVCLTASELSEDGFRADLMQETVRRSSLAGLKPGENVNLELALRVGDRLGGHVVQGHVDGVAEVRLISEDGFARVFEFFVDPELLCYVVEKGSVAIDGVSLTVAAIGDHTFAVSLIPETLERTNLSEKSVGDLVNIELDVLAKYVEKLTNKQQ